MDEDRRELRGQLHHLRAEATERQAQLAREKRTLLDELEQTKSEAVKRAQQGVAAFQQRLRDQQDAAAAREQAMGEEAEGLRRQLEVRGKREAQARRGKGSGSCNAPPCYPAFLSPTPS